MTLTTEQLRAHAESLGLDLFIERRAGIWVKEWLNDGCTSATAEEVLLWSMLANREAQPVGFYTTVSGRKGVIWHNGAPEDDTAIYTAPPAPAPAAPSLTTIELHMGAAISVFNAICDEMISSKVEHSELGAMGAAKIEIWSSKIGGLLEMRHENGGCTLKIITPTVPPEKQYPDVEEYGGDSYYEPYIDECLRVDGWNACRAAMLAAAAAAAAAPEGN
ncbi:hypothetical protein AL485_23260 [Serratia liquefaciens]|uniref:hypothetical protein n=1 Tax=Serratia liquefaciens TaxID=614 RepID=UPI00076B6EE0|nr:hypothetical protein [Serratia liquefaciens]AMH01840.1 hypothetical protein AL485_23260 [Serratia liquefaciens]